MSGYARAHRGRWDHPIFKNKVEAAVWAWMCDTARWRAHSFQTQFGMVTLERGQLLISERGLADDFAMHKNTIRRLLATMQDHGMISLKRDHKASRAGTIVTLLNYERWQTDSDCDESDQDQGGTAERTIAGPRRDQDRTTREEREKREKREEETLSSISEPDLPIADETTPAFAAYEAVRREIDPRSRPIEFTPSRRRGLAARLHEIGGTPEWNRVLASIRGSPFLRGETARSGRMVATIDWLLKPENLRKVREGNYDERPDRQPAQRQHARTSPTDAMRIVRDRLSLG